MLFKPVKSDLGASRSSSRGKGIPPCRTQANGLPLPSWGFCRCVASRPCRLKYRVLPLHRTPSLCHGLVDMPYRHETSAPMSCACPLQSHALGVIERRRETRPNPTESQTHSRRLPLQHSVSVELDPVLAARPRGEESQILPFWRHWDRVLADLAWRPMMPRDTPVTPKVAHHGPGNEAKTWLWSMTMNDCSWLT